jgi:hypothetical protein
MRSIFRYLRGLHIDNKLESVDGMVRVGRATEDNTAGR